MAFRKADLLLPLCLVSAILLNVYAAVDPTGVYRRYLEKLAPMTPPRSIYFRSMENIPQISPRPVKK